MRKGYYACALLVRLVRVLKAVLLEDSLKTFSKHDIFRGWRLTLNLDKLLSETYVEIWLLLLILVLPANKGLVNYLGLQKYCFPVASHGYK